MVKNLKAIESELIQLHSSFRNKVISRIWEEDITVSELNDLLEADEKILDSISLIKRYVQEGNS